MSLPKFASKTILIVDDSRDTRVVLRHTLEALAYSVLEATNGHEAVIVAGRECPDLILMDMNMPLLDGLAATEQIRTCKEPCKHTPIIAITGYDTFGMEQAALEAGCNAYVRKPIVPTEIEKLVDGYLFSY